MVTTIYLIRHGEAEGNLYRRMQGSYNSDLTALGRRQVCALGQRFMTEPLDAVYSSDLTRAMLTAAALCRPKGLPLRTDTRLREVNVGPWEDMPFGNAWRSNPVEMSHFCRDPEAWDLPGADTYRGLAQRGYDALMDAVSHHSGETLAVCIHNYMICAILCKLFYGLGGYLRVGCSENTAVTKLCYEDGRFSLVYKNDSSHLDADALHRTRWHSESGSSDLNFRPMGQDIDLYIKYRRDAWRLIYGNMHDFSGSGFWMDAQHTIGSDPNAMMVGYLDNTPVGMIQLSPDRDARKGVGYIPFIYLRENYRSKGLGIQLIGHAVSFYRNLGRTSLQLSVAHTNAHAIAFYEKYGFFRAGRTKGRYGNLILMEKDIALPKLPKDLQIIPQP